MIFVSWNYGTLYQLADSAIIGGPMPEGELDLELLTDKTALITKERNGYEFITCTITNMIDLSPSHTPSVLSDLDLLQANQEYHKAKLSIAFTAWLDEPSKKDGFATKSDRMAWLLATNGDFDVNGWGLVRYNEGFQSGLHQDEALELLQLQGFMDGIALNSDFDPYAVFMIRYLKYRSDNGYPPLDTESPPTQDGENIEQPNTDT